MPAKVKDYKDFIKAHNKKNCPSITGKKKAELKALAESLGFIDSDVKKAPVKKAPVKKAPEKKEPKEFKTKLQRMAERADKKLELMRAERKKQEIKVPKAEKEELKSLVKEVEKSLSKPKRFQFSPKPPNKRNPKKRLSPKPPRNPNPNKDLKKSTDAELKKDLTIIIDNYIFDNNKKVNEILNPIFTIPKYRAGDVIKEANEKFKKLNPELGRDYKNLFDKFKKYNTEMINRKINTQPYIKRLNDYRKKNISYIKRTLEI